MEGVKGVEVGAFELRSSVPSETRSSNIIGPIHLPSRADDRYCGRVRSIGSDGEEGMEMRGGR